MPTESESLDMYTDTLEEALIITRDADFFEVSNPTTGELIAIVPSRSDKEVKSIVARVRDNQPTWERLGYKQRLKALITFKRFLLDNEKEFTDILIEETGKVRAEASSEVIYLAQSIDYYRKNAEDFLKAETPKSQSPLFRTKKLKVTMKPLQVVGLIGPWNFPAAIPLGDAIPALIAGCGVVIKPSEQAPLTLSWLVDIWNNTLSLPAVLEIVTGQGQTGEALVDEVDYVGFTGSVKTGKKVAERASQSLTPYSLELGGKDPMLVLADADLHRAAAGAAWGGLANAGQTCNSVERIYAEEPIFQSFVDLLVKNVQRLRLGLDGAWADIGAITTPMQLATIEEHVSDAIDKGAKALTGGKSKPGRVGNFYEPTVLIDVDHSMKVMTEETFGPILPVMNVRDEEEAIYLANNSVYGLSSSVWSRDKKRAERIASQIDAGSCNINDVLGDAYIPDVPFGGFKQSGIGYRHGPGGIRRYCRSKTLLTARLAPKSELIWFPYSSSKTRLIKRMAQLFHGSGFNGKFR